MGSNSTRVIHLWIFISHFLGKAQGIQCSTHIGHVGVWVTTQLKLNLTYKLLRYLHVEKHKTLRPIWLWVYLPDAWITGLGPAVQCKFWALLVPFPLPIPVVSLPSTGPSFVHFIMLIFSMRYSQYSGAPSLVTARLAIFPNSRHKINALGNLEMADINMETINSLLNKKQHLIL